MGVPQFTTPTFLLTIVKEGIDLTTAHNVYVTFTSGMTEITKSGVALEVSEKTIGVYLSQAETGKFKVGEIEIQANWTTSNGDRVGTEVVKYDITKQLLRRVVE